MSKQILVSLALLITLLAACSGPAAYSPAPPWVPLAVGNWWLYDVDGMWIEVGDTTHFSYQSEIRITALTEHQEGFQVYEERTISYFNEAQADTIFYYLRETDSYLKRYPSLTTSYSYTDLSFPLELGKSWNYADSLGTVQREVMDLTGIANTPAGLFTDCAVIQETWGAANFSAELFFSAGCGLVKSSSSSTYGARTMLLHSYNVQQQEVMLYAN